MGTTDRGEPAGGATRHPRRPPDRPAGSAVQTAPVTPPPTGARPASHRPKGAPAGEAAGRSASERGRVRQCPARSDVDDDLAAGAALGKVPEGGGGLAEWVGVV